MRICLTTANLASIDGPTPKNIPQQNLPLGWVFDVFQYNDSNFPPRINALSPRLQAKIPRMFGYELHPGYDCYIWMDGSINIKSPNTIKYLIDGLDANEMFLFKHPKRTSIAEECRHVTYQISTGNEYLKKRYGNEPLQEEIDLYLSDQSFVDNQLFAAGCFVYRKEMDKKRFFRDWFYHNCRYSILDQLSLPYLIHKHAIRYYCSDLDIRKNPYFEVIGHTQLI